jgi:hypothetical protein
MREAVDIKLTIYIEPDVFSEAGCSPEGQT